MSMKTRFVSVKEFKTIAGDKAVEAENVAIRKSFTISKMDEFNTTDEKPTLKFSITTQDVDRDGDTISLGGWDFKDFEKNPVVLWAHDYGIPPVAKAINIFRDAASIDSTAEFTPKSLSQFGFMIYQMYKGGFLNAVSVGFQPQDFVLATDRPHGFDFTKQILMEYSAVPVPSNPQALIQARSIGINTAPLKTWAENVLDDWDKSGGGVLVPKTEIELIRANCDEKNAVSVPVKNDTVVQEFIEQEKDKQNTGDDTQKTWVEVVNNMEVLLGCTEFGGEYLCDQVKESLRPSIYKELLMDYERFEKEAPDYRYVSAQVLKHMPEDYYLDSETGQIEKITDELREESEKIIVSDFLKGAIVNCQFDSVKDAAREALSIFENYKDLSCCDEHEKENLINQNERSEDDVQKVIDELVTDQEDHAIFDESVTLAAIAEIVEQQVNEELRKRSGKLD